MSTIKSSSEHLTLNADGASKDIKFQANGVEKASISSAGAFTSTTIDATKLTGNLPAIDGSSLTGISGGGKVLQVVQGTIGGTTTVSTSGTDTYINDYVTITPSATSSRILLFLHLGWDTENGDGFGFKTRVSSDNGSTFDWQSGSANYAEHRDQGGLVSLYTGSQWSILLSPNTTSALTYKVYVRQHNTTTVRYNGYQTSSLIAMEIGA